MYHDPRDNFPRWLQVTIIGLIVYSTVMIMLETVPELQDYWPVFQASEVVVVVLFTIEYLVSWWLSSDRRRFPFRFMNLIDLAAILPFYLSLGTGFTVLRSLRLFRMFRLFKLARYSQAVRLLSEAFRRVGPELVMTGIIAAIAIVISASALYFAEHDEQPEHYTKHPGNSLVGSHHVDDRRLRRRVPANRHWQDRGRFHHDLRHRDGCHTKRTAR